MTLRTSTVELLNPLLDCDVMVYRCGFAADSQVRQALIRENPDALPEEIEDLILSYDYTGHALGNAKQVLNEICSKFRGEPRGFLSGDGNFREQVATILPYKGNRPQRKPKYYKELRNYLVDVHGCEVIHGREADDALATAQWAAKDRSTVICTIDKDLDMVPGWHYNWVRNEIYDVPLAYANMRLFYQMLEGDRTDNIPGIHMVGPKTIAKLFADCTELADYRRIVQEQYQKQYGDNWREAYEEVARLLWMERIEGRECPFLW